MKSFHNTTNESVSATTVFEEKAKTQEEIVLEYFQEHKAESFSPETILRRCFSNRRVPLTSIRRAMSNLTKKKLLEKTEKKKISSFGRPAYKWALRRIKV